MRKAEKAFDAVALMRAARDRISAEIEGMSLEEELRWLASQELHDPFLRRLRERAARPTDPAGGTGHPGRSSSKAGQSIV
jgi:hypothetical protein